MNYLCGPPATRRPVTPQALEHAFDGKLLLQGLGVGSFDTLANQLAEIPLSTVEPMAALASVFQCPSLKQRPR